MGAGTIFKVGGNKCTSKKLENFGFELATVTPQPLKYDVINFGQHVLSNFIQNLISLNDLCSHNTLSITTLT